MIPRLLKPSDSHSFFLFGARGTGKSTLLRESSLASAALSIDLLLPADFDLLLKDPQQLLARITSRKTPDGWVIIDEVQKLPVLLDIVHHAIETYGTKFALTGSSARKLRRGQANLLAGRAFVYHLYPFTHRELGTTFSLESALQFGTLPKVYELPSDSDRELFLTSYAQTYLREEIQAEQVVRALAPFRRFLDIAAQMNGALLNFAAIGRDVGVDDKTVRSYYQILEDTLVGFLLPAYHRSLRKTQIGSPRFYFFDCGVKRALEGTVATPLTPSTSAYGDAFEHFLITEMIRLNSYTRRQFRFYHIRTQAGAEVDVVIERPGLTAALVEIKSTTEVREEHVKHLNEFATSFEEPLLLCLSRDPARKRYGNVLCLPWEEGLVELGL